MNPLLVPVQYITISLEYLYRVIYLSLVTKVIFKSIHKVTKGWSYTCTGTKEIHR